MQQISLSGFFLQTGCEYLCELASGVNLMASGDKTSFVINYMSSGVHLVSPF